jgi:hypothetical protein
VQHAHVAQRLGVARLQAHGLRFSVGVGGVGGRVWGVVFRSVGVVYVSEKGG